MPRKPMSPEHREARSRALKGIKRSPETRARIAASRDIYVLGKHPESMYQQIYTEHLNRILAKERLARLLPEAEVS